ncbi:MAG TPA: hypothetical protein VGQ46_03835 [Thermoanaerobaculia bacterium]|nr:hypothetical protein [Thermoanaerobaculia bacterium]
MNDVLAFSAYLLLPLIGIGIWRLDAVRGLDLGGRIAIAGAAGTAIVAAVLAMLSIVSIAWSRSVVISIIVLITAISIYLGRPLRTREKHSVDRIAMAALIIIAILAVYGLLDARLSCGDLHFFWGPKAVHFYRDGGVTLGFLGDPNTVRMNPGYPLLLPLIYGWSETIARHFSWFSAVLSTALFLFGSVALVRSTSRDDHVAVLMAATLAYAFAIADAAGAGEPPLIFFETLAIVAITFIRDKRAQTVLAALGLAGAVMTKIEGATFAIAVVLALLVVRRSFKRTALIAAPAAVLLAAWVAFVKVHNLSEYYRGAGMPLYFAAVTKTIVTLAKAATYELYGLPWIIPIVLIAIAPNRRNAAVPLLIAVLTFGAAFFFYIHLPDPTWWILASAPRVLLTPLAALLIASAAAWRSAGDLS